MRRNVREMVLPSDGCPLRRLGAVVKAGRRPPPEAARSGLDGGEAGARPFESEGVGARCEQRDVIDRTGP